MSNNTLINDHRRRLLKTGLVSLTLAPAANLLFNHRAEARGSRAVTGVSTEIPKLPESDRQAIALGYKEDGAKVDTSKFHKTEGASCGNCQLYSGSEEDAWGPCAIFSYRMDQKLNRNYVVSAKGWCRSWGPRAGTKS
jgi:hypothetical protein